MNGRAPGVRNTVSASGWGASLAVVVAWVIRIKWAIDMPTDVVVALGVVLTGFTAPFVHLAPPVAK